MGKNIHSTLPQALQNTANQAPEAGIGYIQGDGSLIFQTYPRLLDEAARVLAGLHGLGLKEGDKIILAPSRNEEFIPAFCLPFPGSPMAN